MKIFGIIPVRMGSSRFPGKPLKKILGTTMLEHVFGKSQKFKNWSSLSVTTCDKEIYNFCKLKNYPVIITSKKHKRCLDRVYEASIKSKKKIKDNDIVVCVQGDEPMLHPRMIETVINPLLKNKKIEATVLAMHIIHFSQFINPNIVKIIHDIDGKVLFTSRSPVPYCKKFSKNINARRIYGIFAFKKKFLKKLNKLKPSPLEKVESCDTNRICDNGGGIYIAKQAYQNSFSVDTPQDLKKVEKYMLLIKKKTKH